MYIVNSEKWGFERPGFAWQVEGCRRSGHFEYEAGETKQTEETCIINRLENRTFLRWLYAIVGEPQIEIIYSKVNITRKESKHEDIHTQGKRIQLHKSKMKTSFSF